MKTVKDFFCTLDADYLVDTYFDKYGKTLSYYYNEKGKKIATMTIAEFVEEKKKFLHEYIDYLKTIEVTPSKDGKQWIIYAYNKLEGYYYWSGTVGTELCCLDELKADPENCQNYGYLMTEFSEILGFLVADNQYTQGNIYEVIADVMYEASWYGYRQERLEAARKSLEEADEEIKKGSGKTYDSTDELFKDLLGEEYYNEIKDSTYHETDKEKELEYAAQKARHEYEHYSMVKERKLIFETLKG